VHLQSLCFASAGDFSPSRVRLFTNRDDVDFAGANELKPVQTLDLAEDPNGELWHNVKAAKFANVRSLTVFVEENRCVGSDFNLFLFLFFVFSWGCFYFFRVGGKNGNRKVLLQEGHTRRPFFLEETPSIHFLQQRLVFPRSTCDI
jgi:hypothetical protein